MQCDKLQSRNAIIAAGHIGSSVQVTQPFNAHQLAQKSGEMPFRPNVPRGHHQQEDRQVGPMKEQAEAETRLSIQQCEQQKNHCRTNQTVQTLSQASERRAEPKTEKPGAAKTSALIPAHAAENRAGNERMMIRPSKKAPHEQR